ncbi:helix-turn-helix domain-containing protein [Carnobacterium sp. PL12RED10]|uniref:helix-turn-helix domain-containing protein n=1 Tax=Carnobacterium sp. PL12RED10 TaxID=2592351 RepID=UPI0011ECFBBB|nr:helix-turn-helix transcriptional regulator [Carnobacterium sp. PL12RED10]KAF3299358.1 helix-turn-helix domain-containing protein [Carnobacterium sp. PL12RED10]
MRNNEEIVTIIENRTKEKGLSISELARRVDMAKSAISRYFNRTREFPLNKVDDFAKALDLDSAYILGFSKEMTQLSDINTIYNDLEPVRQKRVFKFAEEQLEEQRKSEEADDILIAAHKNDNLTYEEEAEVQAYIEKIKKRHKK